MKALAVLLSFGFVAVGSTPTIVHLRGAFADGSSVARVIPILQADRHTVIAVHKPLTSLADNVATTKRVIEAQQSPVGVVNRSYGGAVITGAAARYPDSGHGSLFQFHESSTRHGAAFPLRTLRYRRTD
jgi:hypothetical protein